MGKNRRKKKKFVKYSRAYDNPPVVYIFFIIMGLVLALLCAVIWHEGRLIEKDEALCVSGVYESYEPRNSRYGSVSEIEIRFLDRDTLLMDSAYWNVNIENALDSLEKGERFDMLLHPTSKYIWEIRTSDRVLFSFDDARSGVLTENVGFTFILGVFGLVSILMGTVGLALWLRQYKLIKAEKANRSRK